MDKNLCNENIFDYPVFFKENRVFRVYSGGKLLEQFLHNTEGEDSNFPEEWIASHVEAKNAHLEGKVREGVSVVENTNFFWDDCLRESPTKILGINTQPEFLVKILDSAIRLPVQAHPDRAFSKRYFSSDYGKAESWIVLDTRKNAEIFLGFKNKISKDEFKKAYAYSKDNPDIMPSLLNRIKVRPGDIFYIPPKIVHAIGYGCLILEVQEPTDYTISPEFFCEDYKLSEYEKFMGLDEETAFDCFDYETYGEKIALKLKKTPSILSKSENFLHESLISKADNPFFSINRYSGQTHPFSPGQGPCICVVESGKGSLESHGLSRKIKRGDYFFLPAAVRNLFVYPDPQIKLIKCSGDKQSKSGGMQKQK